MPSVSYADVFSLSLDRPKQEAIRPGDRVRTGQNLGPEFDVIAVHDGNAWLRNIDSGTHHVVLLSRCRKENAEMSLLAAE